MLPKIFLFVISTVADTEDKTGEALKFKNQSLYNVSTRGTPFRLNCKGHFFLYIVNTERRVYCSAPFVEV